MSNFLERLVKKFGMGEEPEPEKLKRKNSAFHSCETCGSKLLVDSIEHLPSNHPSMWRGGYIYRCETCHRISRLSPRSEFETAWVEFDRELRSLTEGGFTPDMLPETFRMLEAQMNTIFQQQLRDYQEWRHGNVE